MYNKIIMVGNLTRDVELKYLPSGYASATIGLATNRKFKKQDGTISNDTCFVDVKLFGRTAEIANQYLRKGSRVLIEGRLSYETWEDQTGSKRSKHIVVADSLSMMDRKEDSALGSPAPQTYNQNPYDQNSYEEPKTKKETPFIDISDDEIPF